LPPVKKRGTRAKREPSEELYVSLGEAFSRVVFELTEIRVRQRALLEALSSGPFSWSSYIEAIRTVRARDFDALFGAIAYRAPVFAERFKDWIEADANRYLFRTEPPTPKSPRRQIATRQTKSRKPSSAKQKR